MTVEGNETRQRLLDRAREHYLEVGADALSLREVARRAGVSAAAVYRHFADKDALLGALVAEGFHTFSGYLMRSLSEKTPRERLRASGRNYLAFALENAAHYRVIFMSPCKPGKASDVPSTFQFLVDRVLECMTDGALRQADARMVAATIWAHVHGLASLRLSGHLGEAGDDAAFASFFITSVDDLLRGLSVNSVSKTRGTS